jgi:hypothetical protein
MPRSPFHIHQPNYKDFPLLSSESTTPNHLAISHSTLYNLKDLINS